ncbi:uncharacterized protein C5L36_0B10980 [Pichia kudriavzevii]|mgnify:CR=1 FL=1|uniref:Altered inheritance of mitochondria protein 41 n=1 Tax=Pichia kudriavzevii TaxID=4909 RepID=A0A1V2LT25_PICKU|nr:uncharacterized protein C5L36_0B10980 [Pichia kudriavzevii]AWU75862.1 hypothetical protein C5L36_0B10980 [Pichia kudriavzevii]ONH77221.1 Altered inheritance of mitochondria protein 41, mitochondrial [Pichia kudriavzevii]
MFPILRSNIFLRAATVGIRFNSSTVSSAGALYDGFLVKLRDDLKTCIRSKAPPIKKTTVRGIMSEMKNLEIENHGSVVDEFKIYDHLNKLVKQRKETANEYLKPDQPERFKELAQKELDEAAIISKYLLDLPVATEEEIKAKVQALMASENITDKRQVFSKIPWGKINKEWRASRGAVSDVINKL